MLKRVAELLTQNEDLGNLGVCPEEARLVVHAVKRLYNGDANMAALLFRNWGQWLTAKGYINQVLDMLTKHQWKRYGILYDQTTRVKSGNWVAIGSNLEVGGNAVVAAFRRTNVVSYDQSTVNVYNDSMAVCKSGFINAFHSSTVTVTGEAIVHLYDQSRILSATPMTLCKVHDEAKVPLNFAGLKYSGINKR